MMTNMTKELKKFIEINIKKWWTLPINVVLGGLFFNIKIVASYIFVGLFLQE